MTGQFVGSRFGVDDPTRIAASAELLIEQSEIVYGDLVVEPLIPFYGANVAGVVSGADAAALASADSGGIDVWNQYPSRLDLGFYQGDDVQIPLYFQNPGDATLDMSDENDWFWQAQIRTRQYYGSYKVADFAIQADAVLPTPPDTEPTGITLVTLFLPRMLNLTPGVFRWEMMSTSPYVGPDFPKPPNVADDKWPMTDQVKTWLYGLVYISPRLTNTDYLPPNVVPPGGWVSITPTGPTWWPNGQVP